MNAYMRLIAFDLRLYLRDWLTIFWVLIYPVLMLVIFGSMYGDQVDPETGKRFIVTYVPALCVLNVISVALFTLSINMITHRENGTLRRYRVTPIRSSAVLLSHSIQGLLLVFAGALEIILVAKLIWDIEISPSALITLLGCLLFGCIAFFGLGFAMSGLANNPGAASGLAMIIFFPMLFLSGVTMPVKLLPQVMQSISEWLPMTYMVKLAQGVWQGTALSSFGMEFAVLGGSAIIFTGLALWLFRWEN